MCGICGSYRLTHGAGDERVLVRDMTARMAHRGPDDEGYYDGKDVWLGFRRLSIIDLAHGSQPMSDERGEIRVVFNGEIYNYRELRSELRSLGYRFRTESDTEVLVHGYREWGDEVLERLNAMFGLAIWDARLERLVVARDRMGIKLVYYSSEGGFLRFASEMRSIVGTGASTPSLDPLSLAMFLQFRFTASPRTILKGVTKLAPGTCIIASGGRWRVRRWHRPMPTLLSPQPSRREATRELALRYREAVRRQLVSDVPLGLLLSGGMDSALLLALMSEQRRGWPTFTVGYGSSYADDELVDAAATARYFDARHHEVMLSRERFESSLDRVIESLEEPIASSSIVPMFFVCERAREDTKVVLIGQGPDELFAGYPRHLGERYGHLWRALPRAARAGFDRLVRSRLRSEAAHRAMDSLSVEDRRERAVRIFSLLPSEQIAEITGLDGSSRPTDAAISACWADLRAGAEPLDDLGAFQHYELYSTLPDELLMYADKLSMAHGLEVRVPYLDQDVVEYGQQLAGSAKVHGRRQKWLHRLVARELLPAEILRRRKRGFGVNVVDAWFRDAVGGGMVDDLRDPHAAVYDYLDRSMVATMINQHQSGRRDLHKILFSIAFLERWMRRRATEVAA